MENEKKDQLKIVPNSPVNIKLSSLTPFWQGENEFQGQKKKSFGYNVTKGTEEFTYFASEPVHNLFLITKPEGAFTLELRGVKNKDGDLRNIWYLDGKNLWQYQDEIQLSEGALKAPEEVVVDPTPTQSTNIQPDGNAIDAINERLDKLEKEVYSIKVNSDDKIPF